MGESTSLLWMPRNVDSDYIVRITLYHASTLVSCLFYTLYRNLNTLAICTFGHLL